MTQPQPSQWPTNLQFITSPRYHPSVPVSTRLFLTNRTGDRPASNVTVNPLVRIRYISDPSHPARGQYGLFAVRKIHPRAHIIDYIGEVHCQERSDSDYDLSLHRSQDGVNVGVDASKMGNEARFVNDYRGIKSRPNAAFVEYRTGAGELRMSIWSSTEAIKKGEEILVSYGKAWWRAREDNGSHSTLIDTESERPSR